MGDDPQALASETATPIPGDASHPRQVHHPAKPRPRQALENNPPPKAKTQGEPPLEKTVQRAVPELPRKTKEGADEGVNREPRPLKSQVRTEPHPTMTPSYPRRSPPTSRAKYGKTAKRRINKLTRQREKLQGELQQMQPSAQAADQVTKYLRDADISRDDFLMTLELAAAMRRGDFWKTFYEGVRPLHETGGRVPWGISNT